MMVLFVSQSDKRALKSVRSILDIFAERVGDNTWRTVITEKGLMNIKILLKTHATKNMAVACHRLTRSQSELLWIVGARNRFGENGVVPVNKTKKNILHREWENDFLYMPELKALTAMAALLHDWGKANDAFQEKLKKGAKTGDAYRHEWLSVALLAAIANGKTDAEWLNLLASGNIAATKILDNFRADINFSAMPPAARLVAIIILSHHHLPVPEGSAGDLASYGEKQGLADILALINSSWGYARETNKAIKFSAGLLLNSKPWIKEIKRWAAKLAEVSASLAKNNTRSLLTLSRLALMLADYTVSGEPANEKFVGSKKLLANSKSGQKLDEHLVRVAKRAVAICYQLPRLENSLESVRDNRAITRKSPPKFSWQDRAVNKIAALNSASDTPRKYFVINMASTGCGKTMANAKIAAAVSPDGKSLRYTLAVGLRTLTLQTGDEYKNRIGLTDDELATLIGSAAVRRLHEKDNAVDFDDTEGLSSENILPTDINFVTTAAKNVLADIFPFLPNDKKQEQNAKNRAFIYKPVVVATIDHLMPAVTTVRGGRHLLPQLRLLTSDLVIDEIDDFAVTDLLAIARLIHLAGMLGRNVIISSATIPPDLAKGLLSAYQEGLSEYKKFHTGSPLLTVLHCDEYRADMVELTANDNLANLELFNAAQMKFGEKRVGKLAKELIKRRAYIVATSDLLELPELDRPKHYYEKILNEIASIHAANSFTDEISGRRVSIGLIRMANINPCIELGIYLQQAQPKDITLHVIIYHSRQTLLLRHNLEKYLDSVLKRKEEKIGATFAVKDALLRQHIDKATTSNVAFIVVATPVEEIGRDHDFDWAIVEPSSMRSIIQLAGRVLRHREVRADIAKPNIAIMEHNLKAVLGEKIAFTRPGFESRRYMLATHSLKKLIPADTLDRVNASVRVLRAKKLSPTTDLADLEHQVMADFSNLDTVGASTLHGWLSESWYLTGVVQKLCPFRAGSPNTKLYYSYDKGNLKFTERDNDGSYVSCEKIYGITKDDLVTKIAGWWLTPDYERALNDLTETEENEKEMTGLSHNYGEINIIASDRLSAYSYADIYGLYKREGKLPWEY